MPETPDPHPSTQWPPPGMTHGYTAPRSLAGLSEENQLRHHFLQIERRRVSALIGAYQNSLAEIEKQLATLLSTS